MTVTKDLDLSKLKLKATTKINELLKTSKAILLLLSGGSTLELLTNIDKSLLYESITITVLDERFSNDPKINNFLQFMETALYREARDKGAQFIDTWIKKDESIEEMANRFELRLKLWKKFNPEGVIIATQGIGVDGHTAGVLPYPEDHEKFTKQFENTDKWVVGYNAEEKNPYPLRVTTTIPFLKMIDHSILYCIGENKKAALESALKINEPLYITPSAVIQQMKGVDIFTDQDVYINK